MAELSAEHIVSRLAGSNWAPTGLFHGSAYANKLKASCSICLLTSFLPYVLLNCTLIAWRSLYEMTSVKVKRMRPTVGLLICLTMSFYTTSKNQFSHLPNCNIRSMAASEPPQSWRRPGSWLEELLDDPASPCKWLVKRKNMIFNHNCDGRTSF